MSVAASDMLVRYSVGSGSAGNSTAGTRDTSLGKYMSTTNVGASPNVFFDDVASAEASAGDTEYRCVFVYNSHATDSALNVTVQIVSEVSGGGATTAALDNIAASSAGSASAQAAGPVTDENTAPTGVGTFGTTALTIGTLAAGQCKAVWLKRTVPASTAAMTGDGFTFRVQFDG
jgi:hypothetical protein